MLELRRAKVDQMLGFTKDELKQTRFYRELYEEIYTTAKAQGLQQGHQQGVKEGESLIVLQILKRRFGDLPALMEKKLEILPLRELLLWQTSCLMWPPLRR